MPKGLVEKGETNAEAAVREVREEADVETKLIDFIDKIEYWSYAPRGGARMRFDKFAYFYLLKFKSGKTEDHDQEVAEARWVAIDASQEILAFNSEKTVVKRAEEMIKSLA